MTTRRIELSAENVVETWTSNGHVIVALDVHHTDYATMVRQLGGTCINSGGPLPVAINFNPPDLITSAESKIRKRRITTTDVEYFIKGVVTFIAISLLGIFTYSVMGILWN